ncbi:unnamed protein product [Calicophoron daubneyi]|uniref:ADP-ribosylation factor-binding protein GGA1 n=1 Tax=Calicophoron daubneyi TaxID=300641 RepID=A0AAV2TCC1_CALDB
MSVLENLLNQAINPSSEHYNSDTLRLIVELINNEPSGPSVALRLLAHKIQSPQEREALNALSLLETIANQCNPSFISELGKFKFLNEIVKILSPKYLGEQTTSAVKTRCAQLLYRWQRDFSAKEPKFADAYKMLCEQGIINPDTINHSSSGLSNVAGRQQRPDIFDRNKQSARLAKLLRSRNPADIQEANRIIKSIVEEDQERMEKVTQRSTEMETLKNNTLLLEEMTSTFERGDASSVELELMDELAQNIRRARPLLYSFSLTHDENDIQTLTEIATLCDNASTALAVYEEKLKHKATKKTDSFGTALDSLNGESSAPKTSPPDLLSQDLLQLGIDDTQLPEPITKSRVTSSPSNSNLPSCTGNLDKGRYDDLRDIFSNLSGHPPVSTQSTVSTMLSSNAMPIKGSPARSPSLPASRLPKPPEPKPDVFNELDSLGRRMLGLAACDGLRCQPSLITNLKDNGKEISHKGEAKNSPDQVNKVVKESHQTIVSSAISLSEALPDPTSFTAPTPTVTATETPPSSHNPPDLSALVVQLSEIQPHPKISKPQILYPSTAQSEPGVQLALHYAANQPAPDVVVFVAVVTSHSRLPMKDLNLRFGVHKPLHLRQLDQSGNSLPAYSPFLPSGAINQVVLLYDPLHESVFNLKFQLSFSLDDDDMLESGTVELPAI